MSTILDALRKAEADAKRGNQPVRATQEMLDVGSLPPPLAPGRRLWPWVGGVAVLVGATAAGIGGWWFAERSPAGAERTERMAPQTGTASDALPAGRASGHSPDSGRQPRPRLPAAASESAPQSSPAAPLRAAQVAHENPASGPALPAATIARPLDAASVPPATGAPAEVAPAPAVVIPPSAGPGAVAQPQVAAVAEAQPMPREAGATPPPAANAVPPSDTAANEVDPAALPPRRRVDLPRLERRDPEEAARARQARADRQRSVRAEIVAARQSRQELREAMEDARAASAPPPASAAIAPGAAGGHAGLEPERARLPGEAGSDIPPNAVRRVPAGAPEVKLSIVQWSATPSRRFAFVTVPGGTMAQVREGEEVNGLTVNRIYQGAVEFSHAGQTFVLRAN